MKIAYLISAYKDPSQLFRMLKALDGDNIHFFIHVDKKVDIKLFTAQLPPPILYKLTFTDKRFYVQWGGFNQVKYQYELLKTCLLSDVCFDRVFLLTAQDYPLWSNAEIERELSKHPKKEYIIGLNISNISQPQKIRDKLVLYHFFRDMNYLPYKIKKIFSGGSRAVMRTLPIRKKPYIVIDGKIWEIWQSSSYMCITSGLAKFLLNEMETNKTLMNYFKTTFVPEEMVIPTIIFNSPYAAEAEQYPENRYPGLSNLSAITYFNYGKSIQVFKEEDYDELKACGRMFARKMETGTSDRLMDLLDYDHGIKKIK